VGRHLRTCANDVVLHSDLCDLAGKLQKDKNIYMER